MTEESRVLPKRRFKKFQNTEGWEQRKLEEMTESFEYGLNVSATVFDGINKYIRITDIDDDSRLFNQNGLMSPNFDSSKANRYLLKNGDVLFARTGASVGKTYRYQESDGKVYYAGFLIRARINQNFDAEFVFQNTLTKKYDNYIRITSQRSGQPGVNAQEYANYELMVPTLGEQEEIGAFFKSFDYLISLNKRKLEKITALKSAYLSEMFPAEGEKKPKRRFAGFTDDWEQCKVGEFYDFKNGLNKGKEFFGKGIPIVNFTDVFYNRGLKAKQLKGKVKLTDKEIKSFEVRQGDIFFTRTSEKIDEIGYPSVMLDAPKKTVFSGFVLRGRAKKNDPMINVFKKYVFFTDVFRTEMQKKSSMTTRALTSGTAIKEMGFSFPVSKEEQEKIGQCLSSLDHLISLYQRKLEKLQNLKKAYLNEMFV